MTMANEDSEDNSSYVCTGCESSNLTKLNEYLALCGDCEEEIDIASLNIQEINFTNIQGTSMVENFEGERRAKRHDGRSLKSSICDIIDNAIDASASEIHIFYDLKKWRGEDAGALVMVDNGNGISREKMISSLSFNTDREGRKWWELGSFGVGLKDSSLAHGNELTLFSRTLDDTYSVVRLSGAFSDHKQEWTLIDDEQMKTNIPPQFMTESYRKALEKIQQMNHGTIVLLEDMSKSSLSDQIHLGLDPTESIADFISMIFCDYLQGIDIGPRRASEPLTIYFNSDQPLIPLDPFFKSEIGEGILGGVDGTFMQPHDFTIRYIEGDMDFTINRYIIPRKTERNIRDPRNDERMISALGNSIENCQGIYFKRNSRILDGPWNGENWRRTQGMGMGTNHHTVARWEFILPPESIKDVDLIPPDKRSIRTEMFSTEILNAKNERLEWHVEDQTPYGSGQLKKFPNGEAIYTTRARSHNDSQDIPRICNEEGCGSRAPYNEQLCEEHRGYFCNRCNTELDDEGDNYCDECLDKLCSECEEAWPENSDEEFCINCKQEPCAMEGCTVKSQVSTEYCLTHELEVCKEPHCRNISEDRFNRCKEHLMIYEDDGVVIHLARTGAGSPAIQLENSDIKINLDKEEISKILRKIRGEIDGL
jgi:hypothetical protein